MSRVEKESVKFRREYDPTTMGTKMRRFIRKLSKGWETESFVFRNNSVVWTIRHTSGEMDEIYHPQ
jgi:hypothetical protein